LDVFLKSAPLGAPHVSRIGKKHLTIMMGMPYSRSQQVENLKETIYSMKFFANWKRWWWCRSIIRA